MNRFKSGWSIALLSAGVFVLGSMASAQERVVCKISDHDRSTRTTTKYKETVQKGRDQAVATLAALSDTFLLHSNPGADKTIYLDFDGHAGGYKSYNFEGNTKSFTDAELTEIQLAWQSVAEDFIPFEVNVTTEEPPITDLQNAGGSDTRWGIRCVISTKYTYSWGSTGSFNSSEDAECFVTTTAQGGFNDWLWIADSASHEVGHTMYLAHDGMSCCGTSGSPFVGGGYYYGHGADNTYWSPIMGYAAVYGLSQWDKGEYDLTNNTEDDLSEITTLNGFGYRVDDHGNTTGTATPMVINSSAGIIERNTDVDYFSFTMASSGNFSVAINPDNLAPNLDVLAKIHDASGAVLHTDNPIGQVYASFDVTLAAGDYYISVDGTGEGTPTGSNPTGSSDYGSLGYYSIDDLLYIPAIPQVWTAKDEYETGEDIVVYWSDASAADRYPTEGTWEITIGRDGNNSYAANVDQSAATGGALNGSLTFTGGLSTPGIKKARIIFVENIVEHDFVFNVVAGSEDTFPPLPNPAGFASAPSADSDSAISMTATTGSDANGVEYSFVETSGNPGGSNSGWQSSSSYTDTGLTDNTQYTYTVRMRDTLGNTGSASAGASETTDPIGGPCVATDLHVDSISLAELGAICYGQDRQPEITVVILDDCGNPVANALVDVTLSGDFNNTFTDQATDANGSVTMKAGVCNRRPSWTATVTDVTHGSLPYDSNDNVVTSASM